MGSSSTPGKGLLKVSGILLIIFGAIALVVAILGLAAIAVVSGVAGSVAGVGGAVAAGVVGTIAVIFAFIPTILSFIAGIIGVKHCDNPAKAQTCFVWGIILVVLQAISLILAFSAISLIGLVLPILYLVGAVQNKNAAA